MCGIAGYIGNGGHGLPVVKMMNGAQYHRGPDGGDVFATDCGRVCLGMTRLSIVDEKTGQQPMTIDGGDFTIVFNGEIFNAPILRAKLVQDFREVFDTSHSDTEVIVRLFKHYGADCFSMLNGMFALAIYSRESQTVTLARDTFGIKPLLYSHNQHGLIFGSELRSLLLCEGVDKTINSVALSQYLDCGFVNAPLTIYSGVCRLQPGQFAELNIQTGKLNLITWKEQIRPNQSFLTRGHNALHEQICSELKSALERWLISDVPVCYSLSGGLDSSALVGIGSSAGTLNTYSVGYRDKALEMWDEVHISSEISKEVSSIHEEIIIDLGSIEDDLYELAEIFAEPYGGGLPSYYLFRAARNNGHRVMITGVGGDELFGNYSNAVTLKQSSPLLASFDAATYIHTMYGGGAKSSNVPKLKSEFLSSISWNIDAKLNEMIRNSSSMEEAVHIFDENTQLPNEFLTMLDLLSMNFSVEARTPFLDKNFSDLMRSIPFELRCTPKDYKSLLVNSVGGFMPNSALGHAKSGFSLPLSVLMRKTMRGLFDKLMSRRSLESAGFYNSKIYPDLIEPFLRGDNRFVALVWRVFFLQFWLSQTAR